MKMNRTLLTCLMMLLPFYHAAAAQDMLTLSEGLKIVTEDSRVIKVAKWSEALAESDAKMARSAMLPDLTATAAYTYFKDQPAMLFEGMVVPASNTDFYHHRIVLQQILFAFRGNLSRYDAAKMIVEAQKFDSVRARNEVALEFIKSFYNLLEARHLSELAAKEIERLEAHNRNADQLYEKGVITKNDLLQVQVRLSDARQNHLSAQNLESILAAKLNNLLLRPLNDSIEPQEQAVTVDAPRQIELENAWEMATTNRPEILVVDRTLSALDLDETVKRSEFLPKLFVSGANEYTQNDYQAHENEWLVTFGITINLYNGGRSSADLQKTRRKKKQLLEQRAQLVDGIKLELQSYLLSQDNAYASILVNRDAAGQAEENLRINKNRYEEGEGTATEVLDAITLLTVAETNRIRSVYDYRRAEAAVHYAMGEDLRDICH